MTSTAVSNTIIAADAFCTAVSVVGNSCVTSTAVRRSIRSFTIILKLLACPLTALDDLEL